MSSEESYLPEFFTPERLGLKMNSIQRSTIALGSLFLIVASLYPPWTQTVLLVNTAAASHSVGYSQIWSPPEREDARIVFQIDIPRLAVEYVAILAFTFGLVMVTAARRKTGSDASDGVDTGLDDSLE